MPSVFSTHRPNARSARHRSFLPWFLRRPIAFLVALIMSLFRKFVRKGFALKPIDVQLEHQTGELKRVLGGLDLLMFGVGGIVGAGVFVLTGETARKEAGPAVVISYLIASLSAIFSALCYAEFAVDLPVAGTAFNYLGVVYGEFLAWIGAINLIMEYCLTSATVAKGFTGYFATFLGFESDDFIFRPFPSNDLIVIDIPAFVLTLLLSLLLCYGIKESSTFNNVVTGINLLSIFFVLCVAFPLFNRRNLDPFVPPEFGVPGIFRAASTLFFSYIGFDGVATVAEEVKDPQKNLPIGIVGSLFVVTVLYVLMAFGIVGMVNYKEIDINAAYAAAFQSRNMPWVSEIISIGALTGIITALLLTLLGMTRIFMVLGRERFLPLWISKVNGRSHTPINSTMVTFLLSGLPALLFDINFLADMVSMGTLFVLGMVCTAVIWRTHYKPGGAQNPYVVAGLLVVVCVSAAVEGLALQFEWPAWIWITSIGIWCLSTLGFCFLPRVFKSTKFHIPFPLKPVLPSMGILLNVHLICSLGPAAYIRFAVWQVLGVIVYFFYSMHHTPEQDREKRPLIEGGGSGSDWQVNSESSRVEQ